MFNFCQLGDSGTIKILSTHKSTPIRRNLFHASPRHHGDDDVVKCHTEVSGAWKPQSRKMTLSSNKKIKMYVFRYIRVALFYKTLSVCKKDTE